MRVEISSKAARQIRKLPKVDQLAVVQKIRKLSSAVESEKLKNYKNTYRARVGVYRVVFKKSKTKVEVIMVGHRKDVYKALSKMGF